MRNSFLLDRWTAAGPAQKMLTFNVSTRRFVCLSTAKHERCDKRCGKTMQTIHLCMSQNHTSRNTSQNVTKCDQTLHESRTWQQVPSASSAPDWTAGPVVPHGSPWFHRWRCAKGERRTSQDPDQKTSVITSVSHNPEFDLLCDNLLYSETLSIFLSYMTKSDNLEWCTMILSSVAFGLRLNFDSWTGYVAERQRFIEARRLNDDIMMVDETVDETVGCWLMLDSVFDVNLIHVCKNPLFHAGRFIKLYQTLSNFMIFLSFSPGSGVFPVFDVSPGPVFVSDCDRVREVLSRAQERRGPTVPFVPIVYGGDSHNAWAGDGCATGRWGDQTGHQ